MNGTSQTVPELGLEEGQGQPSVNVDGSATADDNDTAPLSEGEEEEDNDTVGRFAWCCDWRNHGHTLMLALFMFLALVIWVFFYGLGGLKVGWLLPAVLICVMMSRESGEA